MWGGAAALGVAGFAFMASNTVAASSAGQGSMSVTGYTVSEISYNGGSGYNCGSETPPIGVASGCQLDTVSFLLTSNGTGPAFTNPPNFVYAGAYDSNQHGLAYADGCALQGSWDSGSGSGTYLCTFNPTNTPIWQVASLDVEANQ